ncbi:MAG: hypothetical protein M3Q23_13340 [Actinomycetota bacterium]|nr:hypothetical protein [Actinomycetota bacterium]
MSELGFYERMERALAAGDTDPQTALTSSRARLDQLQARYHQEARNPSSFAAVWLANVELILAMAVDRMLVCRVNGDELGLAEEDLRAQAIAAALDKANSALGSLDRRAALAALDACWAMLRDAVP